MVLDNHWLKVHKLVDFVGILERAVHHLRMGNLNMRKLCARCHVCSKETSFFFTKKSSMAKFHCNKAELLDL